MDPLTHTLTGVLLADTRAAQRVPLATPTLLIAVNLPDVDVLSYLVSADAALAFRRGWTHGVLAMAVSPLVLVCAIVLFDRWRHRRSQNPSSAGFAALLPLAYLAMLTHPLLDWLNTYGIRLLMPFEDRWFYGDTLFIIDPWIWLTLGGAAFLAHSRSRRGQVAWAALAVITTSIFVLGSAGDPVARVIWLAGLSLLLTLRARFMPMTGQSLARLAGATLVAAGVYITLLYASSALARRDVEARLPGLGIAAVDLMTGPLPIRPLTHTVIIETATEYRFGSYDWLANPRLRLDPLQRPKPVWRQPAVSAAAQAPCIQGMVSWVRYPWFEIEQNEHGYLVYLMDARYTRSRTLGFGGASVTLRPDFSDACEAGSP